MHNFVNFAESVGSLLPPNIAFVCYSLISTIFIILGLVYTHDLYTLVFFVLFVLCMLNAVMGLILLQLNMKSLFAHHIQSFHFLSTSFMVGFWLFYRSDAGPCSVPASNSMQVLSCNPLSGTNSLPTDTLLYVMLTPIVYLITCPNVSWEDLLKSWVTVLMWISLCIAAFNTYNTIFAFLLYVPISALIMFKLKYERYSFRLKMVSYESKIEELEVQSQQHDKEIKNMLSNVAHDMKTVIILTYITDFL